VEAQSMHGKYAGHTGVCGHRSGRAGHDAAM